MNILVICGSLNQTSTTAKALKRVMSYIKNDDVNIDYIDFIDEPLPFFSEDLCFKVIENFKSKIANADGIILGSPEYHGSISGVLKNSLDFITVDEFSEKVVCLVGTAGGAMGASNVINQLNIICRNLHSYVIPISLSIPSSYMAFEKNGEFKDKKLELRSEQMVAQFLSFISCFSHSKV